jgi:hypothetical protein
MLVLRAIDRGEDSEPFDVPARPVMIGTMRLGAASEVVPKFVSPSDPAAQRTGAMRGPAFFACVDN